MLSGTDPKVTRTGKNAKMAVILAKLRQKLKPIHHNFGVVL